MYAATASEFIWMSAGRYLDHTASLELSTTSGSSVLLTPVLTHPSALKGEDLSFSARCSVVDLLVSLISTARNGFSDEG